MTTADVAERLVEFSKQGTRQDLFTRGTSLALEARLLQNGSRETIGLDGILGRAHWSMANNEVHTKKIEGPVVAGSLFCVHFTYDLTSKPTRVAINSTNSACTR